MMMTIMMPIKFTKIKIKVNMKNLKMSIKTTNMMMKQKTHKSTEELNKIKLTKY